MKRIALSAALLVIFLALPAFAQQQVYVTGIAEWRPYASETIAVTNGAVSTLTASKYARQSDETYAPMMKLAWIFVTGNPINFWIDGSTPTTSVGMPAAVGQWIKLRNKADGAGEAASFKAISTAAGGSTLYVTYERQ